MSTFITKTEQPGKIRKHLPCLGCGATMWTDPGHRICKKCQRRNSGAPTMHMYRTFLPRETWPSDTSGIRASGE